MFKNLQIKSLLLLLVGLSGSVTAFAKDADETIASATFNGKNATYTEGWTTTGTGKNRTDCVIIGAGENITSPSFDLSGYTEVTISIKARRFGTLSGSKATIDASIGGTSVGTVDANSTSATTQLDDITFTPTSSMTNAVLVFTCTNATSAGSSHGAGINSITITGKKSDGKPTPTVTIDADGITNTDIYNGTTAGSLSATVTYNDAAIEGATVTWSGDNDGVATIDATGSVTLVAAGSVTFTATFAGNDEYNGATATYGLSVTNSAPNVPGTENNPYTVAQAIAYINTLGTSSSADDVYVSGIISQVDSYNSTYSSITYWISDDGTTANQMEVYSGKGLEGADFSSKDDLQVGDIVTVKGKVKMYKTTPEFDYNNQLVSFERPTAAEVAKITVTEPLIELDANEHSGNIAVQYENVVMDSETIEVQFVDAEGETAEYDWIIADLDANYGIDYIVDPNNGAARTAYLRVYGLDADAEDVCSNIVTITQAAYVAPDEQVEPAQAGVGCFVKVTSTQDITAGNYLIVYEGNETHDAVAFDGSLETLDAKNNGVKVTIADNKIAATSATVAATFTIQPSGSIQSASGYYIGKETNSNGLDAGQDEKYANTIEIDSDGNAVITASGNCTLRYNYASDQLRFRYYKSGQQAVQLYKYDSTANPFLATTVTDAGWATWVPEFNVEVPQGVSAYIVTGTTESNLELTEVLTIPANEPVVLKNEGTYEFNVITENDLVDDVSSNLLQVSDGTIGNDDGVYVLANKTSGVGFYKWAGGTLAAGRVYLPAQAGARSFLGFGNGTSTGIEAVESLKADGSVFDLQGRRVAQPTKGLYVVDGKKVVVK